MIRFLDFLKREWEIAIKAMSSGRKMAFRWIAPLRAILQESEAKLEMKIFNPPSFFVWR